MFRAHMDTRELTNALRGKQRAVTRATRLAQIEAGHTVEAGIKRRLSRYSHPKGTATPSPPGQPPAVVSGTLRRSVRTSRVMSIGPHRSEISVGPTVVYARAQDQGAHITAGFAPALAFRIDGHFIRVDAVDLPARPYVAPTVNEMTRDGSLHRIYRTHWARAMSGRS